MYKECESEKPRIVDVNSIRGLFAYLKTFLLENKGFSAVPQPKFISLLPMGYALDTFEEGDFFRKYVKMICCFYEFFTL